MGFRFSTHHHHPSRLQTGRLHYHKPLYVYTVCVHPTVGILFFCLFLACFFGCCISIHIAIEEHYMSHTHTSKLSFPVSLIHAPWLQWYNRPIGMHRFQCGRLINAENMENKLYRTWDDVAENRINTYYNGLLFGLCTLIVHSQNSVLTLIWKTTTTKKDICPS